MISNELNLQTLDREEMKLIKAGNFGPCDASVSCPNGGTASCYTNDSNGYCYSEGDGTAGGFVNCNFGEMIVGCWMIEGPGEA